MAGEFPVSFTLHRNRILLVDKNITVSCATTQMWLYRARRCVVHPRTPTPQPTHVHPRAVVLCISAHCFDYFGPTSTCF